MKFSIVLLCLLPLVLSCSEAQTAEQLTIGFWNVQNLLDQYDDPIYEYDEKHSDSAVQQRIGKDAEVIRSMDADIIGLAEVENREVLRRLVAGSLHKSGYKYVNVIEGDDPRGIDCALISRIPCLVQAIDIPGLPRDLLVARFTYRKQVFYVLVNHWKSRRDGGGEDVRMKCARTVIETVNNFIVECEGRAVPVVVVGDFNDTPQDDSLKYLTQQGLINTMESVPDNLRWTIGFYNRDANQMELDCFDQILINQQMKSGSALRWKSTRVHRPRFMINDRRSFNGVRIPLPIDDYKDRIGYSDHFPVIATFEVE